MAALNYFVIDRVETGNRIYTHRKRMHLSQMGLADALSVKGIVVSITSIGKWERGEVDISAPHARVLAEIFGCKLCELVVARLSFYDDERDQLAPVVKLYIPILKSICRCRCSFFIYRINEQMFLKNMNQRLISIDYIFEVEWGHSKDMLTYCTDLLVVLTAFI